MKNIEYRKQILDQYLKKEAQLAKAGPEVMKELQAIPDSPSSPNSPSTPAQPTRSSGVGYVAQGNKEVKVMQAALKHAAQVLTKASIAVDNRITPNPVAQKNIKAFSDFFIQHFVGSQNPTLLSPIGKEFPAGSISVSPINAPVKEYEENKRPQRTIDEVTEELKRVGTPNQAQDPEGVWGRRTQNNVRQILAVGYGLIDLKSQLGLEIKPQVISKSILDDVTEDLPKGETPYTSKVNLATIANRVTDIINKILLTYISFQNYFQTGDYAAILSGDKSYYEDKAKLNTNALENVTQIEYSDNIGSHTVTIQDLASASDFNNFILKNYPEFNKLSKDEKAILLRNIKQDINNSISQNKNVELYNDPKNGYRGGATQK